MKPRNILLLAALLSFILAAPAATGTAAKTLMVYYMPWYSARPYSGSWGWHWTMDHFNPDLVNASGERQIASWYYPLIGPYDSSDPAVLEYHVLLMKLAGIDGVIVDWYGSANFLDYGINNQATMKLFQFTRKAGLKFSICYEDQTIQHMLDDHYLATSNAIPHAQSEMLYLQTNFFSDASYIRLSGQPVLLNFGPQHFMANSNWEDIFSVLAATNQPAFFTEDNRLPVGMGAFSWPPMWMSQAPGTGGVLSGAALKGYLADFDQKAGAWPAFISSAFPRFHDIYQRAGVRNYWGYLGDRHGDILRETLSCGLTNSSALVQIVTWNDFGEGSMIEPTEEYGYRDLGIIQDYRRQYLESDFSRTTNNLAMALQFYNLRRQSLTNTVVKAELDDIFTNIISGQLDVAKLQLDKLSKP
jgi:Glycosyl hydrolase family 99